MFAGVEPVLPSRSRMRAAADFRATTRRGPGSARAAAGVLVVHVSLSPAAETSRPAIVGFVVSKAVGNAVTRNRVRRRLRHLAAQRIAAVPAGSLIVVRVAPQAAGVSSNSLGVDLDVALDRAMRSAARASHAAPHGVFPSQALTP